MIVTSILTLISADLSLWTYLVTVLLGAIFAFQIRDPEKNAGPIFHGSITYLSIFSIVLVAGVFV